MLVTEASYRYHRDADSQGRAEEVDQRAEGRDRRRSRASRSPNRSASSSARLGLVVGLFAFYVNVDHFDPAAGGQDATFSLTPDSLGSVAAGASSTAPQAATQPTTLSTSDAGVDPVASAAGDPAASAAATTVAGVADATPTTLPTLPRRVVVVGDSQAHSLAINLPDGIGGTFAITDGSVEGCGVYDAGKVVSSRQGFKRSFGDCAGWAASGGAPPSSSNAEVALVVLGAWDVFDVELADRTLVFGTPAADAYYLEKLQSGIDALTASGAQVALLEVPCMRPQDVKGAGVPALPERGDDARTGHVNDLLRQAAAADPTHVTFVPGPTQWCNDEAISSDLAYRWDGVHVYKPGANLIYETIAPSLLAIPVDA